MHPVPSQCSALSATLFHPYTQPQDPEIWFDAIDHVVIDETWFDAGDDPATSALLAGDTADTRIPLTEDCRRGLQRLVQSLADYSEQKILSFCLARLLPGTPGYLIMAANSLYEAIIHRRQADIATLHTLGLVSWALPEAVSPVFSLAAFMRETIRGWVDETFLGTFLESEEHCSLSRQFIALAVTFIVASRWMKNEGAPQRGVLKLPACIANMFMRASDYWNLLAHLASSHLAPCTQDKPDYPLRPEPAFTVDTSLTIAGPGGDPRARRLVAFSSNSTLRADACTRATVTGRPQPGVRPDDSLSVMDRVHYLAMDKLRQASGLSQLMYCSHLSRETREQREGIRVTHLYFNSQCAAITEPQPLPPRLPAVKAISDARPPAPGTLHKGMMPLSLLGTAIGTLVTPSYLQTPQSKALIAAKTLLGLVGLRLAEKRVFDSVSAAIPASARRSHAAAPQTAAAPDIQTLTLSASPKRMFETYNLISDYSGSLKRIPPRRAINLGLIRPGSEGEKTSGYLTFSLPPKNRGADIYKLQSASRKRERLTQKGALQPKKNAPVKPRPEHHETNVAGGLVAFSLPVQSKGLAIHHIGVIKKIQKGISHISFQLKTDTWHSMCTLFSLYKNRHEPLFSLSRQGQSLVIETNGVRETRRGFFAGFDPVSDITITVNRGLMSFFDIRINHQHIHMATHATPLKYFSAGVDCRGDSRYYREASIKDLTTRHLKSHDLLTDWSGFVASLGRAGIAIDSTINPFTKEGLRFYGSEEHLQLRAERQALFKGLGQGRTKRSVSGDALLTTALNAVSFVHLTRVLADPATDREAKENAVQDYLKITSADIFSFSAGLVEHMDPFKLVSGPYSSGVKTLLKNAGAAPGIIFSALNFIDGVEDQDIAKIASASLGILGTVSGVVLSGFTGFGLGLFLMGGGLILDAISDSRKRGKQRELFFQETVLNMTRNRLYHYAWVAKTNQAGESENRDNDFILKGDNAPDRRQVSGREDPLFYETLSGRQLITPAQAGSVDNVTYNTDPDRKYGGFIGFKMREKRQYERLSHIIYTSDSSIKDTSYIGHANQGRDNIEADGRLLNGDDTIYSRSQHATIDAGEGNDIVFVSGKEDRVEGGAGVNTAIIDGLKGKVTLNVLGDGHALLGDTLLKNFGSYLITGRGHEVIINPRGLSTTIPIFICSGAGRIILRNPEGMESEGMVVQTDNTRKLPTGSGYIYASVPNTLSVGGKVIALQKGFTVSTVYDD